MGMFCFRPIFFVAFGLFFCLGFGREVLAADQIFWGRANSFTASGYTVTVSAGLESYSSFTQATINRVESRKMDPPVIEVSNFPVGAKGLRIFFNLHTMTADHNDYSTWNSDDSSVMYTCNYTPAGGTTSVFSPYPGGAYSGARDSMAANNEGWSMGFGSINLNMTQENNANATFFSGGEYVNVNGSWQAGIGALLGFSKIFLSGWPMYFTPGVTAFPDGLKPYFPLRIHFKVEFPPLNYLYIQAIEPFNILSLDSFTNVASVKVRFYLQNGTKPASSDGLTPANTTTPISMGGETEFPLDSVPVSIFNKFSIGRMFYKIYSTPLVTVVNPTTQYVVVQFLYTDKSNVQTTSMYYLIDDYFATYKQLETPPAIRFTDPKQGGNVFSLFLTSLGKKMGVLAGRRQ